MKNGMKMLIGFIIVIALITVPVVSSYNALVSEESNVDLAWSQVESQLQRRNDLIPNLVNSVKGSMGNEQAIFGAIADARAGVSSAKNVEESIEANNKMNNAVTKLLVSVEAYPELTSNENVRRLMDELAGTENRITVERKRFNEQVQGYNNRVRRFPTSIIASITGFEKKPYFEAVEGAEVAPTVNFD